MATKEFSLPIHWNDHEDIAIELYEKFGDDFDESKIYRIRFTDLLEWVGRIKRRPFRADPIKMGLRVAGQPIGSLQLRVCSYRLEYKGINGIIPE